MSPEISKLPVRKGFEVVVACGLASLSLFPGCGVAAIPALALANDLGTNWAANALAEGYSYLTNRDEFRDRSKLNHDIARILSKALKDAVHQLAIEWPKTKDYEELLKTDKDEAERTREGLKSMREHADRIIDQTNFVDESLKNQSILNLLQQDTRQEAEAKAEELFRESLEGFFMSSPDPRLIAFIQQHLVKDWLYRFNEELKNPNEQGTRAWRAYQMCFQEDITARLQRIELSKTTNHSSQLNPDPEILAKAHELLQQLPLDHVPLPSTLPIGSKMPFAPNPQFVGREKEFKQLAQMLVLGKTTAIVAATGLGGIGKTHLASELAHRYGQFFAGGVFWLNAETAESIEKEIADCGIQYLNLASKELAFEEQIKLTQRAWESELPRLIIFDNCEDEAILKKWRPKTGGSCILLTSRRSIWLLQGIQSLPLGVLPRSESIALLRQFRPDLCDEDANAIAAEVGDLPLALQLAGGFLKCYEHSSAGQPRVYLQQMRDKQLLGHPALQGRGATYSPTDHENHVGRTFALSYDKLNKIDRIDAFALALLLRITFFAHGILIPRDLLLKTLDLDDPEFELDKEDALQRLIQLGLLDQGTGGSVRIHRLVAAFVQQVVDDVKVKLEARESVIRAIHLFSSSTLPTILLAPMRISERKKELLHVLMESVVNMGLEDEDSMTLCESLANALSSIRDKDTLRLLEYMLSIQKRVWGIDHPNTITTGEKIDWWKECFC